MVGFDPKMTRQELESEADEWQRKLENRSAYSAGQGILCPALSAIAVIAMVIILTFAWRSCIP